MPHWNVYIAVAQWSPCPWWIWVVEEVPWGKTLGSGLQNQVWERDQAHRMEAEWQVYMCTCMQTLLCVVYSMLTQTADLGTFPQQTFHPPCSFVMWSPPTILSSRQRNWGTPNTGSLAQDCSNTELEYTAQNCDPQLTHGLRTFLDIHCSNWRMAGTLGRDRETLPPQGFGRTFLRPREVKSKKGKQWLEDHVETYARPYLL